METTIKTLPAKYSKLSVFGFWTITQLAENGFIGKDSLPAIMEHMKLSLDVSSQIDLFESFLENFKDNQKNMKQYFKPKKITNPKKTTKKNVLDLVTNNDNIISLIVKSANTVDTDGVDVSHMVEAPKLKKTRKVKQNTDPEKKGKDPENITPVVQEKKVSKTKGKKTNIIIPVVQENESNEMVVTNNILETEILPTEEFNHLEEENENENEKEKENNIVIPTEEFNHVEQEIISQEFNLQNNNLENIPKTTKKNKKEKPVKDPTEENPDKTKKNKREKPAKEQQVITTHSDILQNNIDPNLNLENITKKAKKPKINKPKIESENIPEISIVLVDELITETYI